MGAIKGEGPERKVETVEVIPKIEDAGEPGAGAFPLLPTAIGALGPKQVVDSPLDRRMPYEAGVQQPHKRPGGLGGGARASAGRTRVVVGMA